MENRNIIRNGKWNDDFDLVVNCADEIAKIVAKYKKQYLESVVRIDIVEAYGM